MSSDNIPLLQYTSNINNGQTVTTEKVIAGQYSSLNFIVKSDVTLTVFTDFSGDGTYWDYTITTSVNGGTNKSFVVTVQGKWIRLRISNASGANSTYLRLYTYGTPTNSSVLAQLANIGNKHPVVDIGNLPTNFSTPVSLVRYKHQSGPSGASTGSTFYSQYPSLSLTHTGGSSTYGYQQNGLYFSCSAPNKAADIVTDVPMIVKPYGFGLIFSARFTSTLISDIGGFSVVGGRSNFGDTLSVGYYKTSSGFTYNDWGIYYAPAGAVNFIPRSSFNVDKCDGSSIIPVLTMTQYQTFQFVVTTFGFKLYIYYDGEFNLVHVFDYRSSTTPMFRDNAVGYYQQNYIDNAAVTTSGVLLCQCSDWELQQYGPTNEYPLFNITRLNPSPIYSVNCTPASTIVPLVSIQNFTLYQGSSCFRTLRISKIRALTQTSRTNIRFSLNPTYSVAPVYASINNYSQARDATTGIAITAGTGIPISTQVIETGRSVDFDYIIDLKPNDVLHISGEAIGGSSLLFISFFFE